MAKKISTVALTYEVVGDKAAQASLQKTANATKELNAAQSPASVDRLNAAFDNQQTRLKELQREQQAFADEVRKTALELEKEGVALDKVSGGGGGGRSSGTSRLTQLGSKIRSLPSTQIPGAGGLATDAIGNVLRVLGALPPAILPVIAGLGLLGVGFVLLGKQLEGVRAQLTAAIEAQNKYYKDAATLTAKQAQDEIQQLKRRNDLIKTQVENEIRVVQVGADSITESFKGIFDVVGVLFGETAAKGAKILASDLINKDVTNNLADLKKQYDENNASIQLLEGGLKDGTFAVNDLNEALKQFQKTVTDQTIASIAEHADVQQQLDKLIAEGTQKELEAKKKQLEATQKNAETQLKDLQKNIAASKEGSDVQKAYQEAFDRQNEIYRNATYELGQLGQASVLAAVKLNDAKALIEKQNEDIVSIYEKYGDATNKEIERDLEARANIEKKYQDALIKAAETLADAGEKALQALRDKRDDLLTSFGRGERNAAQKAQQQQIEDQIAYQEQSAKAARDHARELLRIQADAQAEQEDAIAARDFTALFKSRRNVTIAIQNSNREFQEQEAERALQFAQRQAADARQYEFERQQRAQAFLDANLDAEKQYKRQLAQANANYQKQLQAAASAANNEQQIEASKHSNILDIQKASAIQQIQLVQMTEDAKEKIFQEKLAAAQALFASGGVSGIGNAAGFAGVASNISNSSSSNASFTNVFNISGSNQGLVDLINRQVSRTIAGYLN